MLSLGRVNLRVRSAEDCRQKLFFLKVCGEDLRCGIVTEGTALSLVLFQYIRNGKSLKNNVWVEFGTDFFFFFLSFLCTGIIYAIDD